MADLLKGMRAIITGASSGIGQAIALEYVKQGAIVGLIARRVEKLKELTDRIKEIGGSAFFEESDVTNYELLKKAINKLVQTMGGLDIIIANAGVNIMTAPDPPKKNQILFIDTSESAFDKVAKYINNIVDINLKGEFYTINAGLFHLMKSKTGRVIATSSIMAVKPFILEPYYASTKAGINAMIQGYEKLYNTTKITFNAIMPSSIDTEMMARLKSGMETLTTPEELAPYYVFFATEEGKKENGKCINHEFFLNAMKLVKENQDFSSKSWNELAPLLSEKLGASEFKHVKENRKLFMFLLQYKK